MAHTIREKKKLLARVGRIRGQVEAIERALTDEAECERIMHMIAGIRGSVAGLMAEVVEDHIRTHLVDPEKNPGALNADAADQLIDVVHTYLKRGDNDQHRIDLSDSTARPRVSGEGSRQGGAAHLGGDHPLHRYDDRRNHRGCPVRLAGVDCRRLAHVDTRGRTAPRRARLY